MIEVAICHSISPQKLLHANLHAGMLSCDRLACSTKSYDMVLLMQPFSHHRITACCGNSLSLRSWNVRDSRPPKPLWRERRAAVLVRHAARCGSSGAGVRDDARSGVANSGCGMQKQIAASMHGRWHIVEVQPVSSALPSHDHCAILNGVCWQRSPSRSPGLACRSASSPWPVGCRTR
jgi:hypothetical protein